MQRRHVLVSLVGAVALGALAGCGFRLRGNYQYAYDSIYIDMQEAPQFGKALVKAFAQEGKINVWTDPGDQTKAQMVLVLGPEQFERVITAVTASGQVRELQVRIKIAFRLRDATGKDSIAASHITQQRDISYNETQALGKESEENRLHQDLLSDAVQQLQRRLVAVGKPL